MSDTVVASAAVQAPAKTVKSPKAAKTTKVPKAKKPVAHPPYINMVTAAINGLKERKGSSKIAILKYITKNYNVGDQIIKINARLRDTLNKGVVSKALVQSVGTGASGRFRVTEKKAAAAKKPVAKKAATGEKKAKKPVAQKAATGEKKAKKTTATKTKKTADKVKKVKSPKKIAKPTAKKVAKSPAKKSAPKKAAAAKPAKKAVAPKT
ncbi:Histone H1.3 [Caenorhabditis elegans]|uniref:Histone H1.3 n=1 Tax=Caenorhabditis elegans TaxID=6239 RepID=H13_CAEEL|nr:Histone H1.3 [Caenorhabditis elegans]Q19743.3 RecName: Full=Histone H1.3; AltName: Full=Histone H1-like protein 3 [Caenorhabditis elegans]AAB66471.1 histone H1.3 [Caenorhabditis elegans]CCD62510.1 Histone H1.3 [Caenorhabditis elegans]|eukprot:NP_509375.1 Histone H1.3 [Caenorhabditis elegans]